MTEKEFTGNPIITYQDNERWPVMEVVSQPCGFPINETDLACIEKMDQILDALDTEAAGLAAVQIGYPKRIFLLRDNETKENRVFINPEVLSRSKEMKRDGEACLSLPGMGVVFKRPKSITIQYFNLQGESITEKFDGFGARCVSHEMDHLNGKLISHHLEKEYNKNAKRSKFGMVLSADKISQIRQRRIKNKNARRSRKLNVKK